MGYYTRFSLKVHSDHDVDIIADLRKDEDSYAHHAFDAAGQVNDEHKWYDHEDDMKQFSKKYPDVLFELHGEGEETGDIWNKYFMNGKMQKSKAKITFDEFNPLKLQ